MCIYEQQFLVRGCNHFNLRQNFFNILAAARMVFIARSTEASTEFNGIRVPTKVTGHLQSVVVGDSAFKN